MKQGNIKTEIILVLFGILPVIWFALLMAPYIEAGIVEMLVDAEDVFENPFNIKMCENSLRSVLIFLLIYGVAIGIYFSTKRNYRRGEEHGSAKWGNAELINKKYRQKPDSDNKLLTQHVRIGMNGKRHRRNLNVLVCGGSGSGKTRFYCKPNIMQANTSFVVLDPKGGAIRSCMKSARAQLNN